MNSHSALPLWENLYEKPPKHITVVLKDCSDIDDVRDRLPLLASVQIVTENEKYPLLDDKTTYYVCENNTCYPPTNMF